MSEAKKHSPYFGVLIAASFVLSACVGTHSGSTIAKCEVCQGVSPPAGDIPYSRHLTLEETGFTHSPYAPNAGYVDVRGIPAGTRIRCPYTGKTFVVPPHGPAPKS
jgi:hypothetical protein